ncbi:DUF6517 family protein [Natrialbaceae archaeon A-gly3]
MRSRRAVLAAAGTGTIALTAGCVDFVLGDGPLEFDAARAAPTDEELEATGYAEDEVNQEIHEEDIDVGVTRTVRGSFWVSTYTKPVDVQSIDDDGALFGIVSMPKMEFLGASFNPLMALDSEELLEELGDELEGGYGDLSDVAHLETVSSETEVLGEQRAVDVFEASADFDGEDLDVELLVVTVEHEDDYLIFLGGYPQLFPDERDNVRELLGSIEHPLE